jgi:hypothetical protein
MGTSPRPSADVQNAPRRPPPKRRHKRPQTRHHHAATRPREAQRRPSPTPAEDSAPPPATHSRRGPGSPASTSSDDLSSTPMAGPDEPLAGTSPRPSQPITVTRNTPLASPSRTPRRDPPQHPHQHPSHALVSHTDRSSSARFGDPHRHAATASRGPHIPPVVATVGTSLGSTHVTPPVTTSPTPSESKFRRCRRSRCEARTTSPLTHRKSNARGTFGESNQPLTPTSTHGLGTLLSGPGRTLL